MNWVDISILAFWFFGFLLGLLRGGGGLILSLAGLIVGLALANRYASTLAQSLFNSAEWLARAGAFAVIIGLVSLSAAIISWLWRRLLARLQLGWVDRLVGAFLGLGLGVVISAFLLSTVASFAPLAGYLDRSFLASFMAKSFPSYLPLFPSGWQKLQGLFP